MCEDKNCCAETVFYDVRPATDVEECENGVTITFEIPGVAASGVDLSVKNRILKLNASGSLKRNGMTIRYQRAFELSDAVDVENISAKTKDGVLTLFLPKAEKAKVHRIQVD